ncbi:MAG: histidine--tRNA ligase [Solobacterium sp.]|nr:histidine--tRNA ligase [Solobacterium sp.]
MNYQTPRGTYDILPEEIAAWHEMEEKIHTIAKKYHYQEMRTPYFESTGVFARENDSSDMVNKEMYSFMSGEESYTLRPEGTAGIIRAFDQHKLYGQELPAKLYYMGAMFRHERPQKGRQRQFTQFGVENIGAKQPEVDAECIALGIDIVKALGIQSVKVCLNTLGDDASRSAYKEALRAYFEPHLDCLCGDCHRRIKQNPLRILDCKVDHEQPIMADAPKLHDYLNEESKAYFQKVCDALDALKIPYEIDERLVRGLDYYTHTVFEVISTREDSGAQATIFGGGRYDHLVDYFGGPDLSGIGFAIGLERLLQLSKDDGYVYQESGNCDVYVIGLGEVGSASLAIANELRDAGFTVEANYLPRSLKSQFKSADRVKAKYIVIIGEDELKQGTINVKNTETKEQVTIPMDALVGYIKG